MPSLEARSYLKAAFSTTGGSAVVMPGNIVLNPNTATPVVVTATATYTLTVTNGVGAKTSTVVTATGASSPGPGHGQREDGPGSPELQQRGRHLL